MFLKNHDGKCFKVENEKDRVEEENVRCFW